MSELMAFPDNVEWHKEAKKDFELLDVSQRTIVSKAIIKVAEKPQPVSQGGYGKPLGHHNQSNLTGLLKVKLKNSGLRIVYKYVIEGNKMRIIIISMRDDEKVYKLASKRLM